MGGVLLVLAGLLLSRELRRWRREDRPHSEEVRARAVMGELCPNGWQAQLTLYGSAQAAPPGAPRVEGTLVAVDWSELPGESDEPPMMRRVWAPTIADGPRRDGRGSSDRRGAGADRAFGQRRR